MNKLPLRLTLLGYNAKCTDKGLKYFIDNNVNQVDKVNWVGREVRLKDGSTIKGIISVDEMGLRGRKFDQLILFDDDRWKIE